MKLVVIEGVGKKPAIQKYLGNGYKVFATLGHIRDLPEKSLSVDIENNFKPTYVVMPDKKKIVSELKEEAQKADEVLLATDPDREGEAISWHIANILGIEEKVPARITFNEISKKAIDAALKAPRIIDRNLVDAQQARRVLDRLVGYKLSPVLASKIQNKLSGGRVQSPTLKLVVDREREIKSFVAEEYWPFASILQGKGKVPIKAVLVEKDGKKIKLSNEEEVINVKKDLDGKIYEVKSINKTISYSHAPAPFKTSTMQQVAISKLGLSLKQVTSLAQNLYEGVALPGEGNVPLITYIRTDSTRVSSDAIYAARNYISSKYGEKYIPEKPNMYSSKGNVQDAHEAIRPISLERTPESLENVLQKPQYKLYKLIYERFLASQMAQASFNTLVADIACENYSFKVSGKTPLFPGYTIVYGAYEDEKDSNEDDSKYKKLPDLNEGEILPFIEYKTEQKFTKPPLRYTEATLIKAMEEKGIGRPATYQPTVSVLVSREYIEKEKKNLVPTELGCKVSDLLLRYFPDIMDITFTADMETKLDLIEEGGKEWQDIIRDFYSGFEVELKTALGDDYKVKKEAILTEHKCEKCGSPMVIREGTKGRFLACSAYPKCKNTLSCDKDGNPVVIQKAPEEVSDVKCEKCGSMMVVKNGRYGKFLACPNYPKCKNIKQIEEKLPDCPLCGNPLRVVTSSKGRFYGCTGYPKCNYILNYKPTGEKCPTCGSLLVEKIKRDGRYSECSNKECSFKRKED